MTGAAAGRITLNVLCEHNRPGYLDREVLRDGVIIFFPVFMRKKNLYNAYIVLDATRLGRLSELFSLPHLTRLFMSFSTS